MLSRSVSFFLGSGSQGARSVSVGIMSSLGDGFMPYQDLWNKPYFDMTITLKEAGIVKMVITNFKLRCAFYDCSTDAYRYQTLANHKVENPCY